MLNLTLLSMTLIPVLVYLLSRKSGPPRDRDVMPDYVVPRDVEVESCATHWAIPAGVSRVDRALLREVTCHPDFVEHSVPDVWFKWTPADARRRARQRIAHDQELGVLPIRKHA